MRIIQVWSLKRGILNPPEPLDPEHTAWVERLWWEQDNPEGDFEPQLRRGPFIRMTERELLHRRIIDDV